MLIVVFAIIIGRKSLVCVKLKCVKFKERLGVDATVYQSPFNCIETHKYK